MSLFWSLRGDRADAVRERGAGALAEEIVRLDGRADRLLAGVDQMNQWSFATYLDVSMPRFHGDGCVVIGDAAHAMSPQLGQGVNLALWDAWILAQCIDRDEDLGRALAAYSRQRRAHILFYQRATRWLTPLFQSSFAPAAWARDTAFPIAWRIPPIERQMIRSMAGLKLGFLRRSIRL